MADGEVSKVITVDKPVPVEFDLGYLSAFDINPITSSTEESLLNVARDATQLLLNAILSCPIQTTNQGVLISLPEPLTRLPREKPVPAEKSDSKWSRFARLKGIKAKRREGKMVFDEEKQDWVPKWGYKGQNRDAEDAWAVELDDKKMDDREDPRIALRAARKAKGSSNLKQGSKNSSRNDSTAKKMRIASQSGGPRVGKVIKRSRRH